jgi:hypothetical protein
MAPFFGMLQIIEPETEDFAGPRHRQAEAKAGKGLARRSRRAPRERLQRRKVAFVNLQPLAEIGRHARICRLQVDDCVAIDDAEPEGIIDFETDDPHGSSLFHVAGSSEA